LVLSMRITMKFCCQLNRRPVGVVLLLAIFAVAGVAGSVTKLTSAPRPDDKPRPPGVIEVVGKTQCVPKRKAIIAPAAPPHPVMEVFVALGDRVKKGQPLVKIDDDEPQAALRAKQANLSGALALLAEAKCRLEAIEKGHEKGAVSQEHYH